MKENKEDKKRGKERRGTREGEDGEREFGNDVEDDDNAIENINNL